MECCKKDAMILQEQNIAYLMCQPSTWHEHNNWTPCTGISPINRSAVCIHRHDANNLTPSARRPSELTLRKQPAAKCVTIATTRSMCGMILHFVLARMDGHQNTRQRPPPPKGSSARSKHSHHANNFKFAHLQSNTARRPPRKIDGSFPRTQKRCLYAAANDVG